MISHSNDFRGLKCLKPKSLKTNILGSQWLGLMRSSVTYCAIEERALPPGWMLIQVRIHRLFVLSSHPVAPERFSELCTISADVSRVPELCLIGPGGPCFVHAFSVVLSFGLTELKAKISWMENVRIVFVSLIAS